MPMNLEAVNTYEGQLISIADEFHIIRHAMNLEAVNTYEGQLISIADEYHIIRHAMNLEAVNTYEGQLIITLRLTQNVVYCE